MLLAVLLVDISVVWLIVIPIHVVLVGLAGCGWLRLFPLVFLGVVTTGLLLLVNVTAGPVVSLASIPAIVIHLLLIVPGVPTLVDIVVIPALLVVMLLILLWICWQVWTLSAAPSVNLTTVSLDKAKLVIFYNNFGNKRHD